MRKTVERSVVALICLIVAATLVIGVYAAITGEHVLQNAVGRHRGRQVTALSTESAWNHAGSAGSSAWVEYEGIVVASEDGLAVETDDGELVAPDAGSSSRLAELGFVPHRGDRVSVWGVYNAGEFEIVQLANHTSGGSITLQDDTGKFARVGQGRRRGA